jgi:CheY-like chemotaxis protein
VRDTGIGIAAEMQANLFDGFIQIVSPLNGARPSGTGLGLAITNRLARLMGGMLSLQSTPGKGSTFSFTINTQARESPPALSSSICVKQDDLAKRCPQTILCAEDTLINVKILRRMLNKLGYEDKHITFVDNGVKLLLRLGLGMRKARKEPATRLLNSAAVDQSAAEGPSSSLSVLESQSSADGKGLDETSTESDETEIIAPIDERRPEGRKYDVILMDIHMPEMGGLEACEKLLGWHQQQHLVPPYVIAVTASAMKEDREKCAKAGMKGFIAKPIQIADLVSQLERAFNENRANDARALSE